MAGSVYTYVGNADRRNGTSSITASQGVIGVKQSGLLLPSEYQAALGQGLLLSPGPAYSPASSLTAPSVAAGIAGNPNGVYRYVFTFITAAGESIAGPECLPVTLSNQQGVITGIPLGTVQQGVIGRGIYRTLTGDVSGSEKLVAKVMDNTTTTFNDNVADGSLGVAVPTTDTAGVLGAQGSVGSTVSFEVISDKDIPLGYPSLDVNGLVPASELPSIGAANGVRLATKAALPSYTATGLSLVATANGVLTIDGQNVRIGDTVMIRNELAANNNGLYVVIAPGDVGTPYILTRSSIRLISGMSIGVAIGSTNQGATFVLATDGPIVPGVTALLFTQQPFGSGATTSAQNVFSRAQTVALSGNRTNSCLVARPGRAPSLALWTADISTRTQVAPPGGVDALGGSSNVLKLLNTSGGTVDFYPSNTTSEVPVSPADVWTVSGYFYQDTANPAVHTGRIVIQWINSGGGVISTVNGTTTSYPKSAWTRFSMTVTAPALAAFMRPLLEPSVSTSATGDIYYIDAILFEKTARLNGYFDGTFASSTWSGTAFASTSNYSGEPAYLLGRDITNTVTYWQIDPNGKGSFVGMDAGGNQVTNVGDPVNPTDGLNLRSGASTVASNSLLGRQRIKARAAGTNLCVNPRPGLGNTGIWSSDHATRSQAASVSGDAFGGASNVIKIVLTGPGAADYYPTSTAIPACNPLDWITVSGYAWQAAGNAAAYAGRVAIQWYDNTSTLISTTTGASVSYARGIWQRLSLTAQAPAGAVTFVPLFEPAASGAITGDIFYVDGLLFEKALVLRSYFDGNSPTCSWTGTALQSTSTCPGTDSFLQGRDLLDLFTQWMVDADGLGWLNGIDLAGGRATNAGDAQADTDLVNRRYGDSRYIVSGGVAPVSSLPSKIYAVTGCELGVYWEAFLRSTAGIPLTDFQFDVTCTKGEQDDYRWWFTPIDADAGSYAWSVAVYYNGILLATYSTTLIVTASTAANGVTRKIVSIGDSTTVGSPTQGAWLAELQHLLVGNVMAVTQVGTVSETAPDSTAVSRSLLMDAVSGKTISYFFSDPASPFVFSGSFNFASYLSTNSISLSSGDWVLVHLGINDIFGAVDDATAQANTNTALSQLATMITNWKAAVAGIRTGILMTIPPTHYQEGFGTVYGDGQTQWRYKRNRDIFVETIRATYSDSTVTNVWAVPIHVNLDTRNNFPITSTTLNSRNPTTYNKVSNSVHPIPYGYWQMADSIYAFLKALA